MHDSDNILGICLNRTPIRSFLSRTLWELQPDRWRRRRQPLRLSPTSEGVPLNTLFVPASVCSNILQWSHLPLPPWSQPHPAPSQSNTFWWWFIVRDTHFFIAACFMCAWNLLINLLPAFCCIFCLGMKLKQET